MMITKDPHGHGLPSSFCISVSRYNAPPKVIQLLLEADIHGETLLMDSLYGQLPLHVACRCNLHPDSLQLLLDYDTDKRSVLVQDEAGRLPLHAALKFCFLPGLSGNTASSPTTTSGTATDTATTTSTGTHKSSVEFIFQAMLHGRVERIGLLQWKNEVIHKMIRPLEQASREEGDADTAFFLEESCKALNTLLQKAFLLELVVWKARCVGEYERCVQELKDEHDVVSASVEAVLGMTATPIKETFNIMSILSDHQKRGCRITSGADVIVPAVVSFLENEPVITLLEAAMR
jgi:Ankyrin repeats (3 copies)